ncbi:MAG: glycine betaine ABC transporter substrate-binding protein [Acidimicrobiales bacterium]
MIRFPTGLALSALLVATAALAGCGGGGSGSSASKADYTIAAQSTSENLVLAYIYQDALRTAGYQASVVPEDGDNTMVIPALAANTANLTIDYLGALLTYLRPTAPARTAAGIEKALPPLLASKGLAMGTASPAADAPAIAVTAATAATDHLTMLADLKPYASKWTFGGSVACDVQPTCLPGLQSLYGVTFQSFRVTDSFGPVTDSTLLNGQVEAAEVMSAEPDVALDHFKVLADPKGLEPVGNLVPVMRTAVATKAALSVINKVSAAITQTDLVQLNMQVSAQRLDPLNVASKFVTGHHLG